MTDKTAHALSETIAIDPLKSSDFRDLYADGIYGGVTPRGLVEMDFFSERLPIPRRTHHEMLGPSQIGKEDRDRRESRCQAPPAWDQREYSFPTSSFCVRTCVKHQEPLDVIGRWHPGGAACPYLADPTNARHDCTIEQDCAGAGPR